MHSVLLSYTVFRGQILGKDRRKETNRSCKKVQHTNARVCMPYQLTVHPTACTKLWSLSTTDDELSHNFLSLENGLQMHYLANETTPRDIDALVIYLHGFPDTSWLWEQQLRSDLSSKAQLVALDLPGCGGSDSHSFYGPDEILNAVAEAIVELKRRYSKKSSSSGSLQRSILVSHDW